jgi:hypothetical protein
LFAAAVIALSLSGFVLLLVRIRQGSALTWPIKGRLEGLTLGSLLVVPAILLVTLAPKFYWESFSGDGAHTFESARLLLFQPLPFWSLASGEIAGWPGLTTMLFLFPTAWFIRLFGDLELAVRVPYLMFLVGVYAGILAVVSHRRPDPLRVPERLLLWLALVVYTVAMVFNASYSPYLADVALPTAQVTLAIALFLGFVPAFIQRSLPWLILFGLSTHLCLPSGLLLMGLWLGAAALLMRPRPWRWILRVAGVMIASVVLSMLAPILLTSLGQPSPGQEHGPMGLLKHFVFLQFSDVRRFVFVSFASGLMPSLALFAWRRQDPIARALAVVSVTYFFFFYFQANIALHYFSAVMILPLTVFWRIFPSANDSKKRSRMILATTLAGALSLAISLPTRSDVYMDSRRIGATIDNRLPGYEVSDPAVFKGSEILTNLFRYNWDPKVPEFEYGGSPLVWNYYSYHAEGNDAAVNYLVQRAENPPPEGMTLVTVEGSVALYLASDDLWREHRATRPAARVEHPLYSINRGILFRSVPLTDGPRVINVIEVLRAIGIDVEPILKRLGVRS